MNDYPNRNLQTTYSDKQIQGQMRIWKTQLAKQYEVINLDDRDLRLAAGDFTHRKGKGRARALRKLKTMLSNIEPMPLPSTVDHNAPIALWRTLVPQASPFDSSNPQLLQDCVTVGYMAVTQSGIMRSGVWGLVIPDHALGRALHRSLAIKDPQRFVIEAHDTLLRLRVSAVLRNDKIDAKHVFHVRAGDGAFRCHLNSGTLGTDECPWVFAHTWLNEGLLTERQIILAEDGRPGEQLGESWLLPAALRPHFIGISGQSKRIGKAIPFDCRSIVPMPNVVASQFLKTLSQSDAIWCEYGTSGVGRQLLDIDLDTGHPDRMVTVAHLRVANTSQIEVIHTALDLYKESGGLQDKQLENFAEAMAIASTIPGGKHDDILFDAALARSWTQAVAS